MTEVSAKSFSPRYWQPAAIREEAWLESEFVCAPLGDVAVVRRGAGTHSSEYTRTGVPYVRTSSLINFGIEPVPEHYADEDTYDDHGQAVGAGDVLLSIEGKIGQVALLANGERCVIKNHIEVIRPKAGSSVIRALLFAFLSSQIGQRQIRRRAVTQATIPGLGSASRELRFPVADRGGRSKLADAAAEIDAAMNRSLLARRRLLDALEVLTAAS